MTRPKARAVKAVKAWALTRSGAIVQGIWWRRKDAQNVRRLWISSDIAVTRVLITPITPKRGRKQK